VEKRARARALTFETISNKKVIYDIKM